jgi:hypothetical protein
VGAGDGADRFSKALDGKVRALAAPVVSGVSEVAVFVGGLVGGCCWLNQTAAPAPPIKTIAAITHPNPLEALFSMGAIVEQRWKKRQR